MHVARLSCVMAQGRRALLGHGPRNDAGRARDMLARAAISYIVTKRIAHSSGLANETARRIRFPFNVSIRRLGGAAPGPVPPEMRHAPSVRASRSLILCWKAAVSFRRGKGVAGTGTSRKAHSGAHPSFTSKTSSRSAGTRCFTSWM